MALTAAQKADLRDRVGDDVTDSDSKYLISDARLDEQYTAAGEDLDLTTVYVLRLMYGKMRRKIAQSTDIGTTEQLQQLFEHTKALLDYWERIAGVGGEITVQTAVTHAWRKDSLHTEEPDFD